MPTGVVMAKLKTQVRFRTCVFFRVLYLLQESFESGTFQREDEEAWPEI